MSRRLALVTPEKQNTAKNINVYGVLYCVNQNYT